MSNTAARQPTAVRVWSAAVRCGHVLLAVAVLGALWLYEGGPWHERLGYVALLTAGWRVLYGFAASDRYARFSNFVQPWAATWSYARALRARQEPHHLGHNPLGGWMIVALLIAAQLAAGSGALYATDEFWGDAVVYGVHQAVGWALAALVLLHLAGVVFTSMRQRENLLLAMITGVKRQPPTPKDDA